MNSEEKTENESQLEDISSQTTVDDKTNINPKRHRIDKLLYNQNIRYRGIFSYSAVKIIAFVFLFLAQVHLAQGFINKFISIESWTLWVDSTLEILSLFALPLFLTANFCLIMYKKQNIKKSLILNSILAIVIWLAIVLVYYRYVVGVCEHLADSHQEALAIAERVTKKLFGKIINYNVFVDLALFSLFYFFFFYTPNNIKKKKSLLAFRFCSLIPIIFAITASIIYANYYVGNIDLPVALLPILPCRSLTVYFIFFLLSVALKLRAILFKKWGGTEQEYKQYIESNKSSLEISCVASIIIFVVCLIDFLLLYINPRVLLYGLGLNFYFVFIIPFIMLFSYSKQPKSKFINIILPLIFIVAVIILYLESVLFIFANL